MVDARLQQGLARRHQEGRPIVVGVTGAGQMGTDLIVQSALMKGFRIGAVADRRVENVRAAAVMAGFPADHVVEATSADAISRIIEQGRMAATPDFEALAAAGRIEAIIDATGSPNAGATVALGAIDHGKHIILLNVEADITIGRAIRARAEQAGVVYTGAAGDEPACTVGLIRFAETLGMEVIAAGKGKNNALDIDAVPAAYEAEARARNMNPRILVEFVDGTKTHVEMSAIANVCGLTLDVPGMHGPNVTLETLPKVLCPREDGGILTRRGVVDYTIGKGVAPGVFCVVRPRHDRVIERMADLKVGDGPYFALVRPFHLTSLEVPLTAARAVLFGEADMQMLPEPHAECGARAKRDLAPGDILGRIGMAEYRGFAMAAGDAVRSGLMPIGLIEGATVTAAIPKGDLITYANAAPDESLIITRVRREMDRVAGTRPAAHKGAAG